MVSFAVFFSPGTGQHPREEEKGDKAAPHTKVGIQPDFVPVRARLLTTGCPLGSKRQERLPRLSGHIPGRPRQKGFWVTENRHSDVNWLIWGHF